MRTDCGQDGPRKKEKLRNKLLLFWSWPLPLLAMAKEGAPTCGTDCWSVVTICLRAPHAQFVAALAGCTNASCWA